MTQGVESLKGSPSPLARWRGVVGFVFALAALGFLVYFVANNLREVRAYQWTARPGVLVLSLLVHIVGLAWGVRVWQLVLRRMDVAIGYLELARVWFVSGLGRYLPGKIWQFVGAAHLGSMSGIPARITVTSLAVHTGFFLLGALLVTTFLMPLSASEVAGFGLGSLRWVSPLLLLLVHPSVVRTGLRLFERLARRELASWSATWAQGILLLGLATIGWILTGAAFFLFLLSVTPIPLVAVPAVIGINALAFTVGYLVFVTPAGLGAKEGTLTALLAVYLPGSVAAVLAIASRLWTVAAEVIPAILLLPGPFRSSRPTADPPE